MPSRDPLLTDMDQASGWYGILPSPAPANRLKGRQNADWVVAGAGVTGLGAARRLAELEREARVILLEQHRVGYGASGRNSGFIIDTPHLTEGFDAEYNQRVSRLVIAGLAELERIVGKHAIECEWSRRGHLHAIVESRWIGNLEATCHMLDSVNEDYEWIEGDVLADVVGSRHYHAAVYTPRTVLMNPAELCRGLAETMPENVEVYEESPVHRVEPGSPVHIECAEGSITAKNVLLTTNSFTTALGFLKGRLFPMIAYCSLSRPLTDDEQAAMRGAPEWGVTPAVSGGPTLRRTRSNRIVYRYGNRYSGDFRMSSGHKRKLRAIHEEFVHRRYPMLAKLEMEYTWGGVFCMTRNWASFFGRLEPGVFASGGYAGIGVPRGTISGALLAEYASGGDSELIRDVLAVSGPERLPPAPALGLGVRANIWRYLHRARNER
ncbi:MAG: NAD(P)/FAD-dependent oxidoreductase [Alphaproteobacteria bacterium]